MYNRPYLTATGLAVASILGIAGQMVVEGAANTLFLVLSVVPIVLALVRLRWRR